MGRRMLPDWLDNYMIYTANSSQPRASICGQRSRDISLSSEEMLPSMGEFDVFPNNYIVLVGPSGCRKGTAMGVGYKFLSKIA